MSIPGDDAIRPTQREAMPWTLHRVDRSEMVNRSASQSDESGVGWDESAAPGTNRA